MVRVWRFRLRGGSEQPLIESVGERELGEIGWAVAVAIVRVASGGNVEGGGVTQGEL